MPRIARAVVPEYPHHITQRGNYRQTVFESDDDYLQYLTWLKYYSNKYSLEIWAYCLMRNHVHFVCVPSKNDSLARVFNILHMRHSQYIHCRRKTSGHLWQGRFFSTILDELHLYEAIRYVENNPVRAGFVGKAEEYQWSSARVHVDNKADEITSNACYLLKEIGNWRNYLREGKNELLIENIRQCSITGRPCGEELFIEELEKRLNRRLRALPHGRPRERK